MRQYFFNNRLLLTNSANVLYASNYFISHSYNIAIFVDRLIKLKILLNAAIIYYMKIVYVTSDIANSLNVKDGSIDIKQTIFLIIS